MDDPSGSACSVRPMPNVPASKRCMVNGDQLCAAGDGNVVPGGDLVGQLVQRQCSQETQRRVGSLGGDGDPRCRCVVRKSGSEEEARGDALELAGLE